MYNSLMQIIKGSDLLDLGRAMAELESLTESLNARRREQFICENGHEMSGGEMMLDQKLCNCGGQLIFHRT
jgi:hypothetical protein